LLMRSPCGTASCGAWMPTASRADVWHINSERGSQEAWSVGNMYSIEKNSLTFQVLAVVDIAPVCQVKN
jgi:hypothetical protein